MSHHFAAVEMLMPAVSAETYAARLARLQAALSERAIDVLAITGNPDLYYYTGSVNPLYLLVPATGEPLLLARKAVARIADEVPHLPCHAFTGGSELHALVSAAFPHPVRRLAATLDTAAYATVQRLQQLFSGAELVDFAWEMRTLRMVKSSEELDAFTRAARVLAWLPELLHAAFMPGMSELALSAELERTLRLHGHGGLIRCRREGVEVCNCGVVTAGVHSLTGTKFDGVCVGRGLSTAVPYGATTDPIAPGAPITIDFAFVVDGYHLDQTRNAVWGTPSQEIVRAYQAMCEIEATVLSALRPGLA